MLAHITHLTSQGRLDSIQVAPPPFCLTWLGDYGSLLVKRRCDMSEDKLFNKWGVGVQGDKIVILLPPQRLSKDAALTFAAWIVALAEGGTEEFSKRLDEIFSL